MKHLFDNSEINVYSKDIINLSVGAPGPDLLSSCCQLFKDATSQRLEYEQANNSYLFQYGPVAGLGDFRSSLADFLTHNYGSPVDERSLILTAGASHGMHLIWTILMDPNALIIVDEVTYMIALESLQNFPYFRVVSCPLQDDGPDMRALEAILLKYECSSKIPSNGRYNTLFYTIPVFHNPTGITFSQLKCRDLVTLSRRHQFLIACDDVYNLLDYGDTATPRLFALDDPKDKEYCSTVISNGSFSKILAPGVRVGWIECGEWIANALQDSGILKSGGSVNNYMSGLITTLLQSGKMQQQLEYYRNEYQKRMEIACRVLNDKLNPLVNFKNPKGGYFIWLVFPIGFNTIVFNDRLREQYKVCGIPGSRFSLNGQEESGNCLRICVVFHEPATIEMGINRICSATNEWFSSSTPEPQ